MCERKNRVREGVGERERGRNERIRDREGKEEGENERMKEGICVREVEWVRKCVSKGEWLRIGEGMCELERKSERKCVCKGEGKWDRGNGIER
ncbi:MAG: hypothetical protein ACTS4U_00115 [Candidatus Hodgkinia cicadicola]